MTLPRPFTINVPDETLADLRWRLERTRWPDENPGGGWQYGTDLAYMKTLVTYWRQNYDWRVHEARLNRLRQFTAFVDGIELHFIHEPGVGPKPVPLLLSHGWPGSIVEFERLIPMLTDPARFGGDPADAFTVVAPSLPGYAFSFQPNQLSAPGSYMSYSDVVGPGAEYIIGPGGIHIPRGDDIRPGNSGQWGLGARWRVFGDTEIGAYYLHYNDMNPSVVTTVMSESISEKVAVPENARPF